MVEVEGNSLKYDATKTCFSDVIQYTYYQGSQYRGSSYCTLKGNIVSGDVNGDDAINVTDVGMVIDHILDNTPENFIEAAADVNGDGEVNVTDVGLIIDIILSDGASAKERGDMDELLDTQ